MKQKNITNYLYPLGAIVFWGMSFVWTTQVFEVYQPVTVIMLRLILASLVLLPLLKIFGWLEKIKKADLPLLLFSALFNPFLYFIGENFGLKATSPTLTAIIIALIPVFSPLVAYLTIKERLGWKNIVGILIAFCGVLLMVGVSSPATGIPWKGISMLFLAVAAALVYTVLQKNLVHKYGAFSLVGWQNLVGAVYFIPVFLWLEYDSFIQAKPQFNHFAALLQLAIFSSSLAFIFFSRSLKIIGFSKTNVFTNLIPVVTAIASFFILGETFSGLKIVGMLVVLGGIFLSQRASGNQAIAEKDEKKSKKNFTI